MPAGEESARTESVLYCVIPRELADKLFEPLREHFHEQPGIEVVVDRRVDERRSVGPRRTLAAEPAERTAAERRRVRSVSGRRVDDRRGFTAVASAIPPLPKKARRHAAQLVFMERIEPSGEQMRDADSKRLVVRYQQGDDSVFAELYLRYFNSVYAYARVALSDHHEAEDVTQQVFMRALGALGRYELRPNVPFRSWLFSIARNLVVTTVTGRGSVILDSPEQIDTLREQEPEDAREVADTLGWLTDREVAFFVERLPLAQRQALVLRFMLDLPSHEIARILGRSPTGVRKLQSRALKSLEARLTAVGRRSPRCGPTPTRRRLKPLPVMRERRFALVSSHRRSRSTA